MIRMLDFGEGRALPSKTDRSIPFIGVTNLLPFLPTLKYLVALLSGTAYL